MEVCIPVGPRVLIRKDADKATTAGGIVLPDSAKIPVITGRILAISSQVENNPDYNHIKQYAKVVVDPRDAIKIDLENNEQFVIPVDDVIAVLESQDKEEVEN